MKLSRIMKVKLVLSLGLFMALICDVVKATIDNEDDETITTTIQPEVLLEDSVQVLGRNSSSSSLPSLIGG